MEGWIGNAEDKKRFRQMGMWGDLSLYEYLARNAQRYPGKEALVQGERRLTYARLLQTVDRLSAALAQMGVGAGDIVAIQCSSRPEIPIAHFALNRIGALLLPLHEAWRESEVGHLLRLSKAKVFICPDEYRGFDYVDMAKAIKATAPSLKHILVIGDSAPDGSMALEPLLQASATRAIPPQAHPDADEPALIMVSSGTTALPKASLWSCNNLVAFLVHQYKQRIELSPDDIGVQLAPASMGSTGYVFPVLAPLLVGATSVMMEKFEADEAIELIRKERATFATAVPAQIVKMVDSPLIRKGGFGPFSRFNNAGAPLPYEASKAIEALMNCRTQVSYGSTDGGVPSMVSIHDPQEKRLRTVGRQLPGQEMRIVDDNFDEVPQGHAGEVTWRGANMSWGYLNDAERTRETFRPAGWYLSGDLGVIDEEGYLRIVGRKKEMILRGGHNISPRTIEEHLMKHASVAEVAVAAIPDRVPGERACAFVVLRPGSPNLTIQEVQDFLKAQKMAVIDLPERVEIVSEIPKSAGGKVQRDVLTKMVTEKSKASERA
ncbi:MAG: acyl--CoA ligase [Chloroflexi bacterium]|nr:acyl--CoA ligase [Chloroflexota bacterium]